MQNKKEANKQIKTFGSASFLNDLGSDMISPIWPLFITETLHASKTTLGIIDGIGESVTSLSQVASGYFSDKIKRRKPFIWIGYLFASLSKLFYTLANNAYQIIPFRVLDRAGKIRDAPRDAALAELSSNQNRGRNFGFLEAMDNLGAIFGIILSIILIQFLSYKQIFLIAAIPGALAVLAILFFVKERNSEKIKIYKGISLKELSPKFKFFLFLSAIFAIGSFSYSFLLLIAKSYGIETKILPVFYLILTAFASASSIPFGKLSDRINRKIVLFSSFILWALVCLTLIITHSILGLIFAFVFYGLHKGSLNTVQKTISSELSPEKHKASAIGIFKTITGLCALPASVIAGLLWDYFGASASLSLSLGLALISSFLLIFLKKE